MKWGRLLETITTSKQELYLENWIVGDTTLEALVNIDSQFSIPYNFRKELRWNVGSSDQRLMPKSAQRMKTQMNLSDGTKFKHPFTTLRQGAITRGII